ncbi:uncharacterized protein LOC128275522 [Anopheles cruzii]|uniref:uncharacterized protein LOC128275522 n=1 Tax=Anopheles cruzii TaxID=68878 RepID=UPI0022EC98BF|nr:uncharacterized protein LOC128275522 [Anopheles cruzii]
MLPKTKYARLSHTNSPQWTSYYRRDFYASTFFSNPCAATAFKMELLDLDEDSLMEIFSYFNFEELLFLSVVCVPFLQLCRRHLRKIRHFELDYRMLVDRPDRIEHLRNIFQSLAPSLDAFRFSGGYIMDETLKQSIVYNLASSCASLRHLTINYVVLNEHHLRPLTTLLPTLVSLDMGRCDLQDNTLAEFLQCRPLKLRTLAIPGNSILVGTFFDSWTTCDTLEQLDVSHCSSLNIKQIKAFLLRAARLSAINVTGCFWHQRDKEIFQNLGRSITMETNIPELKYFKGG